MIVAGGRYFQPTSDSVAALDLISSVYPIMEVVSGGARGADAFGESWARRRGLTVKQFPAEWHKHGNAAGPIRNEQMAKYAVGGVAVLFPGGSGTASMRGFAVANGLIVIDL